MKLSPDVNFINILRAAFTHIKTDSLTVFFAHKSFAENIGEIDPFARYS